jgi:hypothetical protein
MHNHSGLTMIIISHDSVRKKQRVDILIMICNIVNIGTGAVLPDNDIVTPVWDNRNVIP